MRRHQPGEQRLGLQVGLGLIAGFGGSRLAVFLTSVSDYELLISKTYPFAQAALCLICVPFGSRSTSRGRSGAGVPAGSVDLRSTFPLFCLTTGRPEVVPAGQRPTPPISAAIFDKLTNYPPFNP